MLAYNIESNSSNTRLFMRSSAPRNSKNNASKCDINLGAVLYNRFTVSLHVKLYRYYDTEVAEPICKC